MTPTRLFALELVLDVPRMRAILRVVSRTEPTRELRNLSADDAARIAKALAIHLDQAVARWFSTHPLPRDSAADVLPAEPPPLVGSLLEEAFPDLFGNDSENA